ncbi:MAG: 50S ribosomal protein L25/general stress protein Ctc [Odoribacteraceae bacterium]|jgi:large subunit ribosomal protein L25|nr:50S ribosomal protein L25/general stress protein Ctc [Odoribacteraceae bacterium]
MQVFELKGEIRENVGKKSTKALRVNEKVPCVLYGGGENVHFSVTERDLGKLLYTPHVYLVKLRLGEKVYDAIMRDVQFHPVSDKALHVDFYQTFEDKPIVLEVPVKTEGFAEGVQAGGKLNVTTRKLKVKAFMKDMPDELLFNVEKLGVGKSIKVMDAQFENIEIMNAKNVVIVQVKLTRAARAAAQQQQQEK